MNAIQLFHKDGKDSGIFYCGSCRIVHPEQSKADLCCQPYKCSACGVETRKYVSECATCRDIRETGKEKEVFEKAEKVTEWDGWIFSDGLGYGDGYFSDVDDLIEWCEENDVPRPEYVWTCEPVAFAQITVDQVTELITDSGDAYEDFEQSDLNGLDELSKAIEAFNDANSGIFAYHASNTKALVLPKSQ